MQSTENKQPAQDELIAHIRKNLKEHQEPYEMGAWENFIAKQPNKRGSIFWITRLGSVAAVIAICFTLFLLSKTNTELIKVDLAKGQSNQQTKQLQEDITSKSSDEILVEDKSITNQHENKVFAKTFLKESGVIDANVIANNNTVINNGFEPDNKAQKSQRDNIVVSDQSVAAIVDEKAKSNSIDYSIVETQKNEAGLEKIAKNKIKGKWVLGLLIAPSFGNKEELNMGYGLSIGYNISNKLSVVTGVSYNEMSARKDFASNVGMSSILFGNNKSLAAVSQNLTGLDIPLELKYSFNNNVYASLGLSAFAVIGQSRSNTFIQGVVVNKANSSSGLASENANSLDISAAKGQFANAYIINRTIVEKANLIDQNNVELLGFYNFSIGYKRKMLKNHYVALEPFVKLPINKVTQDNLRLVGAGLRVKIDF